MIIVEQGHIYDLQNFEDSAETPCQTICFIKKEKHPENDTFVTVMNGTTNEEVLHMLVDRLEFLNSKMENHHNVNAINHLKEALNELNMRTAERLSRGVEGTHKE